MHPSYLLMALGLVSLTLALYYLRTFLSIMPTLVACVFRAKESICLEDSFRLARERDIVFYILLLPIFIFISWYNILYLDFMDLLGPELRFACTVGILLVYAGLRAILNHSLTPRNFKLKLYTAYKHNFRNFAILTSLLCLTVAGIASLFHASAEFIRLETICTTGVCYLIYSIRKSQIFASARSVLSSILYLCALEFLPTGILVVAAFVF